MFAFLLRLNEAQQFVHRRHQFIVGAQNFAGVIQADLGAIEQSMRFGQALDGFGRKIVALQRHDIDAARPGGVPFAQHERRHIVDHAGQTADKSVTADRW